MTFINDNADAFWNTIDGLFALIRMRKGIDHACPDLYRHRDPSENVHIETDPIPPIANEDSLTANQLRCIFRTQFPPGEPICACKLIPWMRSIAASNDPRSIKLFILFLNKSKGIQHRNRVMTLLVLMLIHNSAHIPMFEFLASVHPPWIKAGCREWIKKPSSVKF